MQPDRRVLQRQEEAAIVRAIEAWKEFRVDRAARGSGRPAMSVFVVDSAEGLAQVALVEQSADRGVLLVRCGDVLVLRQRLQSAVIRRGDRVFEESRTLVRDEAMIGAKCGVALAAHFGRAEEIIEIGGVVLELRLPRRALVVDLQMQLLLRRRGERCRDIERIETERR